MSDEINRRNTSALEQANKELSAKLIAQQIRIDGLVATMSGLIERLGSLENSIMLMRAAAQGRGPSV